MRGHERRATNQGILPFDLPNKHFILKSAHFYIQKALIWASTRCHSGCVFLRAHRPCELCLLVFYFFHSAKSHSLPDIHTQPRFSKHMDPFSVVHTLIELIGAIDAHSTSPKNLARSLKALKDKLTSTRGLLAELEELVKAETSDISSSRSYGSTLANSSQSIPTLQLIKDKGQIQVFQTTWGYSRSRNWRDS